MTRIWTDGSCTDICFVIEGQEPMVCPALEFKPRVTNNEGEYLAIVHALQEAKQQGIQDVEVLSDSELIVRQLTRKKNSLEYIYKVKNQRLQDLRRLVLGIGINSFKELKFTWVPRSESLAGKVLEERKKNDNKNRRKA